MNGWMGCLGRVQEKKGGGLIDWTRKTSAHRQKHPHRPTETVLLAAVVPRTVVALVVRGHDLDEVLEEARAHRLRDKLLLQQCVWGGVGLGNALCESAAQPAFWKKVFSETGGD